MLPQKMYSLSDKFAGVKPPGGSKTGKWKKAKKKSIVGRAIDSVKKKSSRGKPSGSKRKRK